MNKIQTAGIRYVINILNEISIQSWQGNMCPHLQLAIAVGVAAAHIISPWGVERERERQAPQPRSQRLRGPEGSRGG